jgi:ribosomal protein S18 acetylase RimI-like enzyme
MGNGKEDASMKPNAYTLSKQECLQLSRNRELYKIYIKCFEDYKISEKGFYNALAIERCTINTIKLEGEIVAYCIIRDNAILLLCVLNNYRNQGLGIKLLMEAEKFICENGYYKVVLGCGRSYLFQGVPKEYGAQYFFKKFGYRASWTSVDMSIDFTKYDVDNTENLKCSAEVYFRYANMQDKDNLLEAVGKVNSSWLIHYKDCKKQVLLAVDQHKIVGFEIISVCSDTFYKNELDQVGTIGCVGVLSDYQGVGIGSRMVNYGLSELKKAGCNTAYIGYTWLEEWYARLGFKTVSRQWMGEKILTNF